MKYQTTISITLEVDAANDLRARERAKYLMGQINNFLEEEKKLVVESNFTEPIRLD